VDRPISFSEQRVEMTRAYIQSHYGLSPADISIVPHVIVLHWTAADDLEGPCRAFDRETSRNSSHRSTISPARLLSGGASPARNWTPTYPMEYTCA
jgi:beta-N-acetylhexosaminidase